MKRKFGKLCVISLFVMALSSGDVLAKEMTVKSAQGKEITINLLSLSGSKVKFMRTSDQKIFEMEMSTFDQASQKEIKETAETSDKVKKFYPRLRIDPTIGRRLDRDKASSYLQHERVSAKFTIENQELKLDLEEAEFTWVFFGRNPFEKEDYKILRVEKQTHRIAGGQTLKAECKGFVTTFDEDRDGSNIGGHRYEGYALFVKDKQSGDLIVANSSNGHVDKRINGDPTSIESILSLKAGASVTKSLEKAK
jgi:hypothetical protein